MQWPLQFSTIAQEAGLLGHLILVEAIAEHHTVSLEKMGRVSDRSFPWRRKIEGRRCILWN